MRPPPVVVFLLGALFGGCSAGFGAGVAYLTAPDRPVDTVVVTTPCADAGHP